MGDGRYYTATQMFNIIFLTLLIIIIVISFMLCAYKCSKEKNYILFVQSLLGISVICRFVEEIAYPQSRIEFFAVASSLFLLLHIIANATFIILLFKNNNGNKKLFVSTLLLFCIPCLLWLLGLNDKIIFALLTINISFTSSLFMPYRINSRVFNDLKDQIIDYVFITQSNGDVIYKSENVLESSFFKDIDNINPENILSIFNHTVSMRKSFGKLFIKHSNTVDVYFQYNRKPIHDDDKISGYMISFTDITELINLLDKLQSKQEESEAANNKLSQYKDIVYGIEREREINALLQEIAGNQQKALLKLKLYIEDLRCSMDDNFSERISQLIDTSKEDLSDVRRAVTAYMSFYGVEND